MARNKLEDAQRIARKRGGRCLSTRYSKSAVKMLWQCAKGHEWEAVAPSIKMGAWCPFCVGRGRTIKDMRELAQSRSGQCLSPIYGGTKTRLRWRCAEGHVWNSTPKNVLRGTWCPVCPGIQRLSIALMQPIAREKGGECLSE